MYRMNFSALIKIRGPVTYNFHEIIHYKRLFELQTLVSCLLHKRLSNGGIVKYEFNLPQNCSQKAGAFQKRLCLVLALFSISICNCHNRNRNQIENLERKNK